MTDFGRLLPVCFYQQPTISRQSAIGEDKEVAERQKLGGKLTLANTRRTTAVVEAWKFVIDKLFREVDASPVAEYFDEACVERYRLEGFKYG